MTYFAIFPTPIGHCGIAWRDESVVATHLPEGTSSATAASLAQRAKASEGEPPLAVQDAIASITALLEGANVDLADIVCDFNGIEPFSAAVYRATRAIPAGQTLTYGEIAANVGDKQLARKVGTVLGRNPLPIIVPCHRVIGANGKLTGFSAHGGIDTKKKILEIEGAAKQRDLFDDTSLG